MCFEHVQHWERIAYRIPSETGLLIPSEKRVYRRAWQLVCANVFESDKTVTVSGTVTEWLWANPHCFLKFDAKDDKGEIMHWVVETSNPQDMARQGWSRNSFKASDDITITLIQAKNGAANRALRREKRHLERKTVSASCEQLVQMEF